MRIYLAAPLFTRAELAFNLSLAAELRLFGHDVFLPQEHEQRLDMPGAIFQSDVDGVDDAQVVVACLDGADPDSGTCWELGYAYGTGKPAIGFRTDFRLYDGADKVNLMMTESVFKMLYLLKKGTSEIAAELHDVLVDLSRQGFMNRTSSSPSKLLKLCRENDLLVELAHHYVATNAGNSAKVNRPPTSDTPSCGDGSFDNRMRKEGEWPTE